MTTRLLAAAAGIAAAAVLALAPVSAASAHDYVVGSDPAAGSTVATALDTVTVTFNDRVLDLSGTGSTNLLTVTGPDAGTRHFETGCATVADTRLSAPVALGGAGRYTVTYQIVSADGHTVSASYAFTYQPPSGTTAAAGSETPVCGAGGSTAPATTDATAPTPQAGSGPTATAAASTPQPTTQASSTDLGLVIGIAIAIVVLAVIGVVIVLLTSRRRRPAAPDADADAHFESSQDDL